jgi:hypothetical protein
MRSKLDGKNATFSLVMYETSLSRPSIRSAGDLEALDLEPEVAVF